jgi:hypothetical protein
VVNDVAAVIAADVALAAALLARLVTWPVASSNATPMFDRLSSSPLLRAIVRGSLPRLRWLFRAFWAGFLLNRRWRIDCVNGGSRATD